MSSIYRLLLTSQLTRGRAVALGTIGLIGILIAFAIGRGGGVDAGRIFIDGFGLGLLVPTTTLVFASAALGDPAEDGTLVYLWLRPIQRSRIVLAAFAASVSISIPFTVVPTVVAASLSRNNGTARFCASREPGVEDVITQVCPTGNLALAALAATVLATIAYCGLFLGLGLLVRRALVWGLAYVLIWEGFVARSGTSASRLSVLSYARSVLAEVAGAEPPALGSSVPVAVAVPLVVTAVALALTAWALRRVDVR